jgi:hypothetical protein
MKKIFGHMTIRTSSFLEYINELLEANMLNISEKLFYSLFA